MARIVKTKGAYMREGLDNKLRDILSKLPKEYQDINGSKGVLRGSRVTVRCRKRGLNNKPPLYLWDITRNCYISDIKPEDLPAGLWSFVYRGKGKSGEVIPYKLRLSKTPKGNKLRVQAQTN